MKLAAEATLQPPLEEAFGNDYVSHEGIDNTIPDMKKYFVEYQLDVVSKGGTWFVWMRVSHDRRKGQDGRLENSCWIQINGEPNNSGGFTDAQHRIGQTTGFPTAPDLWFWSGSSESGGGLEQGRLNGLQVTLKGNGKDVMRVYIREGRATPSTWLEDVMIISTVDFVPTDKDYENAKPLAVEPAGKLTTVWGALKRQ